MNRINLYAEDGVFVDEKIYCICRDAAILYYIDIADGTTTLLGNIPDESILICQSFRRMIVWRDELVLIPYNARRVHFYNMKTGAWRNSDCLAENYNECIYLEAIVYNDSLVIIGADKPEIVMMDMNSLSYKVVNTTFEKYKKRGELICRGGYSINKDYLYLAIATRNVVLRINMNDWSDEEFFIEGTTDGFSGIYGGQDFLALSPRHNGNLILWNEKTTLKNIGFPFKSEESICYFGGICASDAYIYLYGLEGEYTVKLDKSGEIIEYYEKKYIFMKKNSDSVILGQVLDGDMEIMKGSEVYSLSGMIEKENLTELYGKVDSNLMFDENSIRKEDELYGLKDFISCLA